MKPRKVNIPKNITPEVAYLIGAMLGDGTVYSPIKRNKGGVHWKIGLTANKEYSKIIDKLFRELFEINTIIWRDKRKEDCYQIYLYSKEIHDYFTQIVGIPFGKKAGNLPWIEDCSGNKELFRHFLAGLIDTDGYVGKNYLGLVQKDKKFLERIKEKSQELLSISFKGPYINKKVDNKILAWIIRISNREQMKDFLNGVPLRYKCPRSSAWIEH